MGLRGCIPSNNSVQIPLVSLTCLFAAANAIYDLAHPLAEENLDPREANLKSNLTCLGASSSLNLPKWHGINLNSISMQQLCAKTQYRGRASSGNLGAFYDEELSILIFDDSSPQALAILHEPPGFGAFMRAILQCRARCFCNFGLQDTTQKPNISSWWDEPDWLNPFLPDSSS